jgi:SSS family solute:Na+ symporter
MLAVILAALFTRRISAAAAKTALVAGPICFYLINFAFVDPVQAFLMTWFELAEPLHFLHLLAFVFVLTVLLMVSISAARPVPSAAVTDTAEPPVDMSPWRHARLASAIVVICTLACYVLLAQ